MLDRKCHGNRDHPLWWTVPQHYAQHLVVSQRPRWAAGLQDTCAWGCAWTLALVRFLLSVWSLEVMYRRCARSSSPVLTLEPRHLELTAPLEGKLQPTGGEHAQLIWGLLMPASEAAGVPEEATALRGQPQDTAGAGAWSVWPLNQPRSDGRASTPRLTADAHSPDRPYSYTWLPYTPFTWPIHVTSLG